jgi:hypothetical protein
MAFVSAVKMVRPLIVVLTLGVSSFAYSFDFHSFGDCPRPPPGTVSGACEVRDSGFKLTEESPFPFARWVTCLQRKLGLPSGGYGDAVFFSDLISEWEREIDANVRTLKEMLSRKDQAALEHEQTGWQIAREEALERNAARSHPEGTMYMAFAAVQAEAFPQARAIELACRVEKLSAKHQRSP